MRKCILADRLYVPEEYVTPEHLDLFVYQLGDMEGGYDYGPFEAVIGSIRTFSKIRLQGHIYYAFARGDLTKLGSLFGDLPWEDRTSAPAMQVDLQFKGQLHTWETKQIGQQEAVEAWLKYKSGVIKAPPRFGKCCDGNSIVHTTTGSIPIQELFTLGHPDGELVSKVITLDTKDGVKQTSHLYKKTVDTTITITTKHGFVLEATPNHPLYTKKESSSVFDWVHMDELKIGDQVALKAGSMVFSSKKTKYHVLYARYIKEDRKFTKKVTLRMMKMSADTQRDFLREILEDNEIVLENAEVLRLLQIMLLNFGIVAELSERLIVKSKADGLLDDEIVDIKINASANKPVFDVAVPDGHNFIANGIVSHNTISSIFILTKLKRKTLIIAHQVDLLEQYYNSFVKFTNIEDVKDVKLKQKARDATGRVVGFFQDYDNPEKLDVCLLCWQSLASKKNGAERILQYGNTWGTVIVDECHKVGGTCYARTVNRLPARYRLGLTGTVERVDGREFLLHDIVGPVITEGRVASIPCKVIVKHTGLAIQYSFGEPLPYLYKRMYNNTERREILLQDLEKDVADGKYICFAFHRCSVKQLCHWVETLQSLDIKAEAFYGACKDREGVLERARSGETQVLVCNSQMLTGIDVPRWNVYYSAFPTSNIVFNDDGKLSGNFYQEFSRIRTPFTYEDGTVKKEGIIRDYVDSNSLCYGMYKKRYRAYENQKFKIAIIKLEQKTAMTLE